MGLTQLAATTRDRHQRRIAPTPKCDNTIGTSAAGEIGVARSSASGRVFVDARNSSGGFTDLAVDNGFMLMALC